MQATIPPEAEHRLAATAGELMPEAARLRDAGHGAIVSYSRKVFIPLTRHCRGACAHRTFARTPRGASNSQRMQAA